MSRSNCYFLTCIQISQEVGQLAWYSHLFKHFPQFVVIHTVKGFGIVNKAEIDVFPELFCFYDDPTDVGNLISGSSAFSKSNLNIWKFSSCTVEAWLGEFWASDLLYSQILVLHLIWDTIKYWCLLFHCVCAMFLSSLSTVYKIGIIVVHPLLQRMFTNNLERYYILWVFMQCYAT